MMWFWLLLKILIVTGIIQLVVAYLILLERKVAAYVQDRIGPNRAGWHGLLQPIADGLKFILKEDFVPERANKFLHALAPGLALFTATMGFAVVPFGPTSPDPTHGPQFVLAPGLDVALLYVMAVGSVSVYSIILGGWASNNKYSFLGGLRAAAQVISYEIPLGLAVVSVVLLGRSLNLEQIVAAQADRVWYLFYQPLGFLVFLVAAFAETNRAPFDLAECEQELVGGYHTEYSGMKFAMFFLGEYTHIITVAYLTAILYLGGWDLPLLVSADQQGFLAGIAKFLALLGKAFAMILFMMWVRWTLPRFRFDQLMRFAWKGLIPVALGNLCLTAVAVHLVRTLDAQEVARQVVTSFWVALLLLGGALGLWSWWRRRGPVPAGGPAS
jgi:NADH-quinone oxidoreductase subunit H